MKVFIFIIILGTLSCHGFAQSYEFCVLGKYGPVKVMKKGKKWTDVKTGDKLEKEDIVSLRDSAYLGLVHNSGKTLELKREGKYKIENLSRQLSASTTELIPNLIELIFGNKNDLEDLLLSKKNKKISYTKGAMERSIIGQSIALLNPRKINLLDREIRLMWKKMPVKGKYEVKITDRFNKPVFSKVVDDTFLLVNKNELNLEKDECYFWKVNMAEYPEVQSDEAYFLFLSDKKSSEIGKNLEQLKKQLGENTTPASMIMLAFFYESNLLINEADNSFRESVEMSNGLKDYTELYWAFRQREYFSK